MSNFSETFEAVIFLIKLPLDIMVMRNNGIFSIFNN